MRISKQGQITIPEHLRAQYGLDDDVEVEIEASPTGILIRKCGDGFDRVAGILGRLEGEAYPIDDIDAYINEIRRGR